MKKSESSVFHPSVAAVPISDRAFWKAVTTPLPACCTFTVTEAASQDKKHHGASSRKQRTAVVAAGSSLGASGTANSLAATPNSYISPMAHSVTPSNQGTNAPFGGSELQPFPSAAGGGTQTPPPPPNPALLHQLRTHFLALMARHVARGLSSNSSLAVLGVASNRPPPTALPRQQEVSSSLRSPLRPSPSQRYTDPMMAPPSSLPPPPSSSTGGGSTTNNNEPFSPPSSTAVAPPTTGGQQANPSNNNSVSGRVTSPKPSSTPMGGSVTLRSPVAPPSRPNNNAPYGQDADTSKPSTNSPPTISIAALQHVMMYLTPMSETRYMVPAMSGSPLGSAVVDHRGVPHVEGMLPIPAGVAADGGGVGSSFVGGNRGTSASSPKTKIVGVECGENFVALLTEDRQVWLAGTLGNVGSPSRANSKLRHIAASTQMISGRDGKLLSLSTSKAIRSFGALAAGAASVIPFRLIRWMDCTFRDTLYMIGEDNLIYKNTLSEKSVSTPRRVMVLSRVGAARVTAGQGFFLMIDLCGRLWSMGKNGVGQLGNGMTQESLRLPHLHTELYSHFIVSAAAGISHSIVLTSDGQVYVAGSNAEGQLGLGTAVKSVDRFTPLRLPDLCVGIAAGPNHSLFALNSGPVLTCGVNDIGQLGHSPGKRRVYTPMPMKGVAGVMRYVATDRGPTLKPNPTVAPPVGNSKIKRKDTDKKNKGGSSNQPGKTSGGCACCVVS